MWKKFILDNQETLYSISDIGEVRNDKRNNLLKINNDKGYAHIGLHINGKIKNYRVHRLVALMFIPNPEGKPYVNHIDGNPLNNCVNNLEWVTPQENTIHAVRTGLMLPNNERAVNQYNSNGDFIATYKSITKAALSTQSEGSKITVCCQGKRLTTNSFQWRYVDEPRNVGKVNPNSQRAVSVAQIDLITNEVLAVYPTIHAAAKAVNGTQSAISHVLLGDKGTKTHKGYKWKRVEEIVH